MKHILILLFTFSYAISALADIRSYLPESGSFYSASIQYVTGDPDVIRLGDCLWQTNNGFGPNEFWCEVFFQSLSYEKKVTLSFDGYGSHPWTDSVKFVQNKEELTQGLKPNLLWLGTEEGYERFVMKMAEGSNGQFKIKLKQAGQTSKLQFTLLKP